MYKPYLLTAASEVKRLAFSASPFTSKVKIDPPPLGKYFLYSS